MFLADLFLFITIFMDDSDVIMSTICFSTMSMNVNGGRLTIILTKDLQKYKEQ